MIDLLARGPRLWRVGQEIRIPRTSGSEPPPRELDCAAESSAVAPRVPDLHGRASDFARRRL
ncbi:MAG: hypothetical protein JNM84_25505 [Planctomycetes bacterium]|nr:hypothetical protein [Planctomycetota bacterium]